MKMAVVLEEFIDFLNSARTANRAKSKCKQGKGAGQEKRRDQVRKVREKNSQRESNPEYPGCSTGFDVNLFSSGGVFIP
ncbi:Protein of unknown function [Gryllus bimaculatus]|nr:Protein of unknown function [Gryllus bimaculatus]